MLMDENIIKTLPDAVANQIAAGEVIQRPASVVKELVENAIDAGATDVQIVIKDAGKTLIQVVDNGCGMSAIDARMAFERHATSKIRHADDLFTLHTMGFRGEALPSIVAVSEVEMRTQRPGDSVGTCIIIKGSEFQSQEPCVCTSGTNIMVKHLFFNFVARRRFLKKDSVEYSHILHEFERLALVNTDVAFTLIHNDALEYQLPRQTLKQRIGALFGRNVENNIIPIETAVSVGKITGYVGLPQGARRRNACQYFFVNGRNMRHPYFHKAVMTCYQDLISADVQPNYFISFEVPADRVDVNVHPQKHEIKFEDEQLMWQVLTAAVKESLGKYNVAPAIDFDATDVPDIPPLNPNAAAPDRAVNDSLDPNYNPFATSVPDTPVSGRSNGNYMGGGHYTERGSALNRDWEKLYRRFNEGGIPMEDMPTTAKQTTMELDATSAGDASNRVYKRVMHFDNRYILCENSEGLLIVDARRAHISILFDRYINDMGQGSMPSQQLLFEEEAEIDCDTAPMASEMQPELERLGFRVQKKDATHWIVTAAPAAINGAGAAESLVSIIRQIVESGGVESAGVDIRRRLALAMARTAAIEARQPLSEEEMERLLSELFRLPAPGYTPDGLVVMYTLPKASVDAFFGR